MLVYPELTKEELENLNQMVQPIDRFFNEGRKLYTSVVKS
jgi:cobyrinic acid a,c-diamide synthase